MNLDHYSNRLFYSEDYYQFDELGVKNIALEVMDKETGYISNYSVKVCIIQKSFRKADRFESQS